MKAIVYYDNQDIKYHESFPEPEINHETEVKIKVEYCGICGTDLHEYSSGPFFFKDKRSEISNHSKVQCMGHEICGEIVEMGAKVTSLKMGEKVVIEPNGTCLDRHRFPDAPNFGKEKCCACSEDRRNACDHIGFIGLGFTDGGFADYCVVGEEHVIPYPDSYISAEVAALTEPLAVAWHAVRTSNFEPGQLALVLGGGPIGLAAIISLRGHKAGKIVVSEPSKSRRLMAEKFGAETFDPTEYGGNDEYADTLKKCTPDGFGFNYSYDCCGLPASFDVSVKALRTFGTATNIAIWPSKETVPFSPMDVTLKMKTVTGSMCNTRLDFEQIIEAYKRGLIQPEEVRMLITGIVHLEDGIEKGFKELINNKDKHIKILLTPKDQYRSKS